MFQKKNKIYTLLNTNFYRGWVSNVDGLSIDKRWNFLLQVSERDIYDTNILFRRIVSKLPKFPSEEQLETNKYNVFYRKYIKWEYGCENDESTRRQNLAENLNPINTLSNAQLFFMVICFLSLLIVGITTPIFIIIRHCMILRGEKKSTYKDVIISTGMRFVSFIFIALKASFLISCLILINKYHIIFKKAEDSECTDDTTLFILNYVDEHLEYARKQNWVSLSAVIVIAFCEVVCLITLFVLRKIAEKQKRDTCRSLLESLNNEKH